MGRTADDILKQLVRFNQTDRKRMIFYSAITIACYKITLEKFKKDPLFFIPNVDIPFIYYRMAEVYIYLDRYCPFTGENDKYSVHFKLNAELCLMHVQEEQDMKEAIPDLNCKYPYYDNYYAELMSEFIKQYGVRDKETINDFYNHANRYINSEYAKETGVKNCSDLKTKMDSFLEKRE